MDQIVIDATNATLGRLASYTAKQLLLGKKVVILNCNDAIIAGNPVSIINDYKQKTARRSSSIGGPFFPKSPERIVKRAIRGMIPYHKGRGRAAFKNLRCYNTISAEYQDEKKILAGKEKKTKTITIRELSRRI